MAELLKPGDTCWRSARAERLALLVDAEAYFSAAEAAMLSARRSITLIGWHFDSRTRLRPLELNSAPMGRFLKKLSRERPEVKVRILIWNMALVMSAGFQFYPFRAKADFAGSAVDYQLDHTTLFGASHHQKILVIDDQLAFCGGGDFSVDRWDSPRHLDDDPRRTDPGGDQHPARHEVMALVDGEAAKLLAALAHERWRRATGETLTLCEGEPPAWPEALPPSLTEVEVGVARTEQRVRGRPLVNESERLHLAAIAAAHTTIYLENQYLTSRLVGGALAARLDEPDGPEVVVISTLNAPSWFDRGTMDRARDDLIQLLGAANRHDRLRVLCPLTAAGRSVIVHSKVSVIDDRLLRVGSTNLNNRSMGFDTECDIAAEAATQAQRDAIRVLRDRSVAHFLGVTGATVSEMVSRTGSLGAAISAIQADGRRRLIPIEPARHGWWGNLVAQWQLGDPFTRADSFRPWRRRRLAREAQARGLSAARQLEVHP